MCYLDPYPYTVNYQDEGIRYSIGYRGMFEYNYEDVSAINEHAVLGYHDQEQLLGETLMDIIENSKELKEPTKAVLLQLVKRSFNLTH